MNSPLSTEQMLALAPDVASAVAGRKLAATGSWSRSGVSAAGDAVRGECAASWLESRTARAGTATPSDGAPDRSEASAEAARKRVEQRDERMTGGQLELEQWLRDQVRTGLAGAQRGGYEPFETQAARMVDAQLPGVASRLRGLPAVVASGEGWPGRLLEEYALLHALCAAPLSETGQDLGEMTATVRAQLGVPVPKQGVLNRPPVRDRWAVLAVREVEEERLRVRRTWLRGEQTGRLAMILEFAPPGSAFDDSLRAGFAV